MTRKANNITQADSYIAEAGRVMGAGLLVGNCGLRGSAR